MIILLHAHTDVINRASVLQRRSARASVKLPSREFRGGISRDRKQQERGDLRARVGRQLIVHGSTLDVGLVSGAPTNYCEDAASVPRDGYKFPWGTSPKLALGGNKRDIASRCANRFVNVFVIVVAAARVRASYALTCRRRRAARVSPGNKFLFPFLSQPITQPSR